MEDRIRKIENRLAEIDQKLAARSSRNFAQINGLKQQAIKRYSSMINISDISKNDFDLSFTDDDISKISTSTLKKYLSDLKIQVCNWA